MVKHIICAIKVLREFASFNKYVSKLSSIFTISEKYKIQNYNYYLIFQPNHELIISSKLLNYTISEASLYQK